MKPIKIALCAVCLCVACDREYTGSASAGQAPQQVPATPVDPAVRPQPEDADGAGAGPRRWEIEISGVDLPALSGASVMAMNMPGGTATYRFTSAKLMGSIDLRDTRVGDIGVFEPYNLQLNFLQQQWTCGMSSLNPDQALQVEIGTTAGGYRGTFSGDVRCTPVQGGERRPARVAGWFEK